MPSSSSNTQANNDGGGDGETKVQISLYHYNDDNRIMVYLDKDGRRNPSPRKNRRGHGIAGYTSPTSGAVNQEHRVKAQQLATNTQLLHRKLKDSLFLDACFLSGIQPEELRDRPLEAFRTEPKRARVLTEEEQKLRYQDFQEHRMELLQVVVAEEEKAYVAKARLEESEASAAKKLQRDFSQSLRLEQRQVDRMVKNRKKYERVLEVENRRITLQRQKAERRHESMAEQIERIEQAKLRRKELLKAEAADREARIKRKVEDQNKLAARIAKKHDSKIKYKRERTTQFLESKNEAQAGSKREEELKAKFREQRREQAEKREMEQRELLTRRLVAKEVHAKHVKHARHEQRIAKKTEQRLKIGARARKAQRLRSAAENRQKKVGARD